MNLSRLSQFLKQSAGYEALVRELSSAEGIRGARTRSVNLLGAARPYLLASLQQDLARPIIVVAPKTEHAVQLFRALASWSAAPADVLYFPEADGLPFERAPMSLPVRQQRLAILTRLAGTVD